MTLQETMTLLCICRLLTMCSSGSAAAASACRRSWMRSVRRSLRATALQQFTVSCQACELGAQVLLLAHGFCTAAQCGCMTMMIWLERWNAPRGGAGAQAGRTQMQHPATIPPQQLQEKEAWCSLCGQSLSCSRRGQCSVLTCDPDSIWQTHATLVSHLWCLDNLSAPSREGSVCIWPAYSSALCSLLACRQRLPALLTPAAFCSGSALAG